MATVKVFGAIILFFVLMHLTTGCVKDNSGYGEVPDLTEKTQPQVDMLQAADMTEVVTPDMTEVKTDMLPIITPDMTPVVVADMTPVTNCPDMVPVDPCAHKDLNTDELNCGMCGNVCSAGTTCSMGQCQYCHSNNAQPGDNKEWCNASGPITTSPTNAMNACTAYYGQGCVQCSMGGNGAPSYSGVSRGTEWGNTKCEMNSPVWVYAGGSAPGYIYSYNSTTMPRQIGSWAN